MIHNRMRSREQFKIQNSKLKIQKSKRSPFGLQNESFWVLKGVLLQCKTSPFGTQKDSF